LAAFHQVAADRVADVHGGVQVEPHQLVPAGQPQVEKGRHEVRAARVIHHHVHVPELLDRAVNGSADRGLAGDIGGYDESLAAERGYIRRGLGKPVLATRDHGHISACAGQGNSDRPADPAGRAGDERVLACQVEKAHAQSFHSVGSGQAAGLTRRTISFSTIRT